MNAFNKKITKKNNKIWSFYRIEIESRFFSIENSSKPTIEDLLTRFWNGIRCNYENNEQSSRYPIRSLVKDDLRSNDNNNIWNLLILRLLVSINRKYHITCSELNSIPGEPMKFFQRICSECLKSIEYASLTYRIFNIQCMAITFYTSQMQYSGKYA